MFLPSSLTTEVDHVVLSTPSWINFPDGIAKQMIAERIYDFILNISNEALNVIKL